MLDRVCGRLLRTQRCPMNRSIGNSPTVISKTSYSESDSNRCSRTQSSRGPRASIPLVCQDWVNTNAVYGLLEHDRVSKADIRAVHFHSTPRSNSGDILFDAGTARPDNVRPSSDSLTICHATAYWRPQDRYFPANLHPFQVITIY